MANRWFYPREDYLVLTAWRLREHGLSRREKVHLQALKTAMYGLEVTLWRRAGGRHGGGWEYRAKYRGQQLKATRRQRWRMLRNCRLRIAKGGHPSDYLPHVDAGKVRADRVYHFCQVISDRCPRYLWGGGHTKPLSQVRVTDGLDCSGSVSLALHLAGEYHDSWARVSTGFESWAQPGRGRHYTINTNWEHVWLKIAGYHAWRFDTSPQGSGGLGPRLRTGPRGDSTFVKRHISGI